MQSEEVAWEGELKARKVDFLPLVDSIFLVVAVFFYLILFMVRQQGVEVEVPFSDNSQENLEQFIAVSISRSGEYYVNGNAVNEDELLENLKTLQGEEPEIKVFLRADKEVNYGNVMQALDSMKSAGFMDINLETSSD